MLFKTLMPSEIVWTLSNMKLSIELFIPWLLTILLIGACLNKALNCLYYCFIETDLSKKLTKSKVVSHACKKSAREDLPPL
ncbi:hypothetical protein acsn021_29800 [Anaerocolumna cellulosilytica]|uniref:Uncharacterized protein n=1 Tax=Anaerocolumna cellulosilytica TaxID=433286 RepID=A0A6S6R929_9FIRM|nr:hypothetical protein [Anaerocolumna cellulosilytica]MBB5198118.1 hypothetical protein [Anaerocolumna cellulosilytica]BCJ95411.1 hypothetical protein acsn021_29800 [Anaerocolumna cellulosilytica]